jgi:hypothetical protein
MKKRMMVALAVVALSSLASCGEQNGSVDSGGYSVVPATPGDNVVNFASAFNETQWVILDSDNVEVSKVTSTMVNGFDSYQKSFGKDLTAHVVYANKTLNLTYQISAYYATDDYAVNLLDDGSVDLTSITNSSALTNYDVPETLTKLPEPANSWPVRSLSVIFSDALTQLKLNKSLNHVASSLGRNTRVIPSDGGALRIQDGYLVDNESHDLFAISSSLSGTITLPSTMNALLPCAFAQTNVTISAIHLPANVTSVGESGITVSNFPNLARFVVDEGSSTLTSTDQGIVLSTASGYTSTVLIPTTLVADPLVYSDTAPLIPLNSLYKHSGVKSITLPKTATGFSSFMDLKANLEQITLLREGDKPVSVAATTLANLSSSIRIKVPSSMLSLYKADTVWSSIADNISAI